MRRLQSRSRGLYLEVSQRCSCISLYQCKHVIVATGQVPKRLKMPGESSARNRDWTCDAHIGAELIEQYEDVSMDREDYRGQAVLVLGKGNSAFEFASVGAADEPCTCSNLPWPGGLTARQLCQSGVAADS